jgi:hypothetical protein
MDDSEYIVDASVQTAFDDLNEVLKSDFMADSWTVDVKASIDRLCAVMDRLRHKLDGGLIQ